MMLQLEHLIISDQCTFNQMETIIHYAPKLISLNICLERESGANIHEMTSNLTRLILNMSYFQMNMIQLKRFLIRFPHLMNLEVETRSDLDLCDGCEWENFLVNNLSRLKIFNFKFQLKSTIILNISGIQNVLKSFSSYFWLVEKQWFVAIEWGQRLIYSVPRFSCESADPNFRPPIHCTTLNCKIFYDHINALAVWGQTNRRFTNVKELWLVDNPLTMNIEAMVDVNRIERLICVSSKADLSIDTLINLISKIKNLAYIQFFDIPLSFVAKNKPSPIIRQIRSVELMREYKSFSSIQTLRYRPNNG